MIYFEFTSCFQRARTSQKGKFRNVDPLQKITALDSNAERMLLQKGHGTDLFITEKEKRQTPILTADICSLNKSIT